VRFAEGAIGLPITLAHAAAVAELPLHHGDPFDRLLVAQARLENAVIVSRDRRLAAYGVPVLW
jgi:PIN domain nuclease of toxin-antitoxin system